MMRDSAVVKTQATALGCQEARQWFTPLLSGRTGLTERALVEAHLSRCASCRQEEARLRQDATTRGVTPLRGLLDYLGKAMALTRIAVTRCAPLSMRLHALPPLALGLPLSAVNRLKRASRTGIGHSADLIARLRAVLASALSLSAHASARVVQSTFLGIGQFSGLIARFGTGLAAALAFRARVVITCCVVEVAAVSVSLAVCFKSSARATANVIVDIRFGMTRFAKRVVRFRPRLVVPLRVCLRAVGVVVMLTLTAYTLQWVSRPQQPARATTPPLARVEPTPVESLLPLSPVTLPVEPTRAAPAALRPERPRQSPSGAASLPLPRASVGDALAVPVSVPEHEAPVSTIVGRLSARNRAAAEYDLTALLAGVDGTEIGRQRHTTFVAVRVVVAHSRYDGFTRGLTRIGAWQLEAARSPLPDTVHITIRVTD